MARSGNGPAPADFLPSTMAFTQYSDNGMRPWHDAGVEVEGILDSKLALEKGGMDYEVETSEVFDKTGTVVEGYRRIYRTDTGHTFNVMKGKYTPIINRDIFSLLDGLVEDRVMEYSTVGTFDDGAIAWMLCKLHEGDQICGDTYENYLFATTRHDGMGAFQILPTEVRVVCGNTYMAALRGGEGFRVKIVHKAKAQERMEEARTSLKIVTAEQRKLKAWLEAISQVDATPEIVTAVKYAVVGSPDEKGILSPQTKANFMVFDSVHREEIDMHGPNLYSLAQGITGFVDHYVAVNRNTNRFQATLPSGRLGGLKEKGFAVLRKAAA